MLHFKTATELRHLIVRREVSSREVLDAHLQQIERVNGQVNAIVTLDVERAVQWSIEADEHQANGGELGVLHGLPIVHKDLFSTAGMLTTFGSPIYKDHIPDSDELIIQRLRAAGAISIGKSNTPEFGAGSQTFNEVCGQLEILMTYRRPAVVAVAELPSRWQPGWCRLLMEVTWGARYGIQPVFVMSLGFGHRRGESLLGPVTTLGFPSECRARWRALFKTLA